LKVENEKTERLETGGWWKGTSLKPPALIGNAGKYFSPGMESI
jgi:hypothetical protein